MSLSLEIQDVAEVLKKQGIPDAQVSVILKELNRAEAEVKAEKAAQPKNKAEKYKHVVFVRGGAETQRMLKDVGAWVVKVADEDDTNTLFSRIVDSAKLQNESSKRGKTKVYSFAQFMTGIKRKFTKEKGYQPMLKGNVAEIQVVPENDIIATPKNMDARLA